MAALASRAFLVDDAELLRGAAAGDRHSIATLYDRHRDGAIAVATSVLGDAYEAEDVVHDAFVDLPRMARSYDPSRGRLTHWLYRSVRNRAIDHVRRRSRWVSRMAPSIDGPEGLLAMTAERGPSPLDEAQARELVDLLALLDARHAHVIRLAFVDGWSHSAVARLTGLPLGTVKTRIRNGLRQLRTLMAEPDGQASAVLQPGPMTPRVIAVCSSDTRLTGAVAAHAAGLARVERLDDIPGGGAPRPAGVVVDLRRSTGTVEAMLGRIVGAGWEALPIVVLTGPQRDGMPPHGGPLFAVGAGDPPTVELEFAVTALMSAAPDAPMRERATDRLLRSDGPAVLVGDRLGRVHGATPAAALLFGRTPRQLVGAYVTDLSAMPREWTERQWQELVSTGHWAGRASARHPSGSTVEIWGRAWMPPAGGFVGVFAAADRPRATERRETLTMKLGTPRARRGSGGRPRAARVSREASPSRPRTPRR